MADQPTQAVNRVRELEHAIIQHENDVRQPVITEENINQAPCPTSIAGRLRAWFRPLLANGRETV